MHLTINNAIRATNEIDAEKKSRYLTCTEASALSIPLSSIVQPIPYLELLQNEKNHCWKRHTSEYLNM